MIEFIFKDDKVFEDMHYALKGSPGYMDSELVLTENDNGTYSLIVGYSNSRDIKIEVDDYEKIRAKVVPISIVKGN